MQNRGENHKNPKTLSLVKVDEVLLNSGMRPLYDERLDEFETHSPDLISKNGTPILNLQRERIDLDFLLAGNETDTTFYEKQALHMSGYSQASLEAMKGLFTTDRDFLSR